MPHPVSEEATQIPNPSSEDARQAYHVLHFEEDRAGSDVASHLKESSVSGCGEDDGDGDMEDSSDEDMSDSDEIDEEFPSDWEDEYNIMERLKKYNKKLGYNYKRRVAKEDDTFQCAGEFCSQHFEPGDVYFEDISDEISAEIPKLCEVCMSSEIDDAETEPEEESEPQ